MRSATEKVGPDREAGVTSLVRGGSESLRSRRRLEGEFGEPSRAERAFETSDRLNGRMGILP